MKREFSAGGIVFNKQNQILLINNAAMRDPTKSYWGFPKGHLDLGETSKQAAIREVKEETNLDVEILNKVGQSQYVFTLNSEKIFKVVTMFLMKAIGGELKHQESELLDIGWFDYDAALERISFPKDKQLLKHAWEIMNRG